MSDLFQEIEEEYRREQLAKLWEKYRVAIIASVVAVIVAVAGFEGWRYWRADQLEKSSQGYEAIDALVTAGNDQKAAEELAKLAAKGAGGYPLIAQLHEAGLRADMGDVKGAVALYDKAAASTSDRLFHDFAQLRAAMLLADTGKYEDLKARLEPVANGDSALKPLGQEMLAYVSWRAGKKDEALKLYEEVQKAPNAPASSKRRAQEISSLIKTGVKPEDLKPPASKHSDSLLPPTGESLLPSVTPPQPESQQPNSLLGQPEQ